MYEATQELQDDVCCPYSLPTLIEEAVESAIQRKVLVDGIERNKGVYQFVRRKNIQEFVHDEQYYPSCIEKRDEGQIRFFADEYVRFIVDEFRHRELHLSMGALTESKLEEELLTVLKSTDGPNAIEPRLVYSVMMGKLKNSLGFGPTVKSLGP